MTSWPATFGWLGVAYIAEHMTRIVRMHYRYMRPPGKRKAVALAGPAVVRKRSSTDAVPPRPVEDQPTPANDDRKPPSPGARKAAAASASPMARWD